MAYQNIQVPATYEKATNVKIRLGCYTQGKSDKPVLFLAPFGGTEKIWQPFQPTYFARNGYKFIALEMRGHGSSEGNANEQEYSISLFAQDVIACIDALGIKKVDLVGASMGGMVALECAHMHPERISNLVLVGSYAGSLQEQEINFRKDHELIKRQGIRSLRAIKNKDLAYFGKEYEAMNRDERRTANSYFEQLAAMRVEEYIAADLAIARKPNQQEYLNEVGSALPKRVLLITGERDFFRKAQDEMHAAIPNSKLEIIAEAGHLCWSDAISEAEFGHTIFSFLTK